MTRYTTAEAIVQILLKHGVDTVFGIPGAHMYDFNDALAREGERIKFITARHEQGAGYMAFGYAKSTGKPGVFTVVPGPGVLNSSAALCTAYGANTPVLCITGNIMSDFIGKERGQLHELPDQLTTLRSITDWSERINHPTEAPLVVEEAFRRLKSGRIRPVVIEAPWDVFGKAAEVDLDVNLESPAPPKPDTKQIREASDLILKAKNPLIIVGAGANEAAEEIEELAKLLQAPVTSHRSGKGIVSDATPYGLLSSAAFEYWPKCDLLIGIGSRLELVHFRWKWRPVGLKTVRLDIDPIEMVRLKPDVGIITDTRLGTRALIDRLEPIIDTRRSREEEFIGYQLKAQASTRSVQPQWDYLQAIRTSLPPDGFFVEEICQIGFTARFSFPVYQPRKYVTCGYQDNLGFGFNAALGVKIANPDKCVVAVSGDGGFMFGVQELATAVHHRINLVTIIFNNSSFGNVLRDQKTRYDGRIIGAELTNPDFVLLAESFGAKGLRVTSPDDLKRAVEQSFKEDGPVIIEVPIETNSETSPWTFAHPGPPGT